MADDLQTREQILQDVNSDRAAQQDTNTISQAVADLMPPISPENLRKLPALLRLCASQSERGENFAATPQSCRQAARLIEDMIAANQVPPAGTNQLRALTEDESHDCDFNVAETDDGKTLSMHRFYAWGDNIIAVGHLNQPNHWDDEAFDADCEEFERTLNFGVTLADASKAREVRFEELQLGMTTGKSHTPTFRVLVDEIQLRRRLYTVEAKTLDEALSKAERGETINEEDVKFVGVLERENAELIDD